MSDLVSWMAPYSGWSILLALALLGGAIVAYGLFADRSRGRRRCPRCAYDLSHSPTATCSECGHTLRRERDAFRTRRRWRLATFGLLVAVSLPTFVVQRRARRFGLDYYTYVGPLYWVMPDRTLRRWRDGDLTACIVEDRRRGFDGARFEDRRVTLAIAGREAWSTNAWLVMTGGGEGDEWPTPFRDVDSNGKAECVLVTSEGGNGGYAKTFVLQRDGDRIIDLNAHLAGSAERFTDLLDVDGDGGLELVTDDPTFAYWRTSHAGSPYPTVVLALRDGRFAPSPALMRDRWKPAPAEIDQARRDCRLAGWPPRGFADMADELYMPLLTTMLDLIYAGRGVDAYAFLDDAWPGDAASKRQFIAEFQAKLATSPYRDALVALGHPPFAAR